MAHSERPTILVTGATGRIGTLLRAAWAQRAPATFLPLWQRRSVPDAGWLAWDMLVDPCPAIDPAPALILNLAGTPPPRHGAPDANVALARAAHDAAVRHGAGHLLLASSAAVYPAGQQAALSETRRPHPVSDYGRAKAEMERLACSWTGPAVTILRIGNVVGADGLLGSARPGQSVVLDPITDGAGGPERSWIGPQTLADVLAALVDRALTGTSLPAILNIAQSPTCAMAAMLDAADLPWRFGPPRSDTTSRVALAVSRLARTLGARPPTADPTHMIAEWRALQRGAA